MDPKEPPKTPFFEDKFSVDAYLSSETQRINLKDMLEELKVYRNDLQNLMGEILRTETESIVRLAESLTQLTTKIRNLFTPIAQFREELKLLVEGVISTRMDFEEKFKQMLANYDKTQYIIYQQYMAREILMVETLINSLMPDDTVYEQVLRQGTGHNEFLLAYIKEKKIDDIDTGFLKQLDDFHLELIDSLFVKALQNKETPGIISILKMYKSVKANSNAETIYRIKFMQPALDKIFYHRVKHDDSDQLICAFQDLLELLNTEVSDLHKLIESNPAVSGFNFILNSYWLEVDKHLQETLPHHTPPGNPDIFQKRYTAAWNFFQEVMKVCQNFKISYDEETFETHIKCFNIAVYYEIRYQQIATKFEYTLMDFKDVSKFDPEYMENGFRLKTTKEFWGCLQMCFSSDIFIDQLIENFCKLSMLLVSRLIHHIKYLTEVEEPKKVGEAWEKFYVYCVHDLKVLLTRFEQRTADDLNDSIYSIVPSPMRTAILKGIDANRDALAAIFEVVKSDLVSFVAKVCYSQLQNIVAVPRQYRKTNKELPQQPSNYVIEGVKPIFAFYGNYKAILPANIDLIMDNLVCEVTVLYYHAIGDVLLSVCKIEESLRRLKQRNVGGTSSEEANTQSDDAKIRHQIKLDGEYFVEKVVSFAIETESTTLLTQLKDLI